MTEEVSDLEWLQQKYRERGFIVFACNYPKEIGQFLSHEDKFLDSGVIWKVVGISSAQELRPQLRDAGSPALQRRFFYRAEAMD